jgi:GT2 family glycosyltransferase
MPSAMNAPLPAAGPDLSVLVPTYGRAETVLRLLDRLDQQTLPHDRFEVVVVDDGSPVPIALPAGRFRMRVTLLRQDNAGPGAARNRGALACRAPWTLILNDDAVPAPDLLARHLARAATLPPQTALLGTFDFTPEALRSPFTQLLQATDLLFDFPNLRDGERHPWSFFWTCNLGLPTATLRANPFDAERFREAIVEDVELGYRLQQQGWGVLFDRSLVCLHDHVQQPASYFRRMVRLGVNLARMAEKHGDPTLLYHFEKAAADVTYDSALQLHCEAFHDVFGRALARLEALERTEQGRPLAPAAIAEVARLVRQLGTVCCFRGMLLARDGHDPFAVLDDGIRTGELTSVVVVSYDALAKTQQCLAALRAAADPALPTEFVVVDNGSTDGSAEWLAAQPDVRLIRNADNAGAPRARNQGLAAARGRWLVCMDNDAVVTPGWLRRLLHHAQVDGRSGCVGPVSNRAAHGQQIPFAGGTDPEALRRFADGVHAQYERQGQPHNILTSFCLLFRREVLDAIGGFDERFSPWGWEDDDFTLRATLAGFRNRIARDVFVRHDHYERPEKAARHAELLLTNWRRFADKWAGGCDVPYADSAAVEARMRARSDLPVLRIPLPAAAPSALALA